MTLEEAKEIIRALDSQNVRQSFRVAEKDYLIYLENLESSENDRRNMVWDAFARREGYKNYNDACNKNMDQKTGGYPYNPVRSRVFKVIDYLNARANRNLISKPKLNDFLKYSEL